MGTHTLHVPTPFGMLRAGYLEVEGVGVALIQRHGPGHKLPPHSVNYRAIAWGLRQLGAKACFATAAVGCLRPDWPPGTFVACTDFIDLTYRNLTLYERGVQHVDFSDPFPDPALKALFRGATSENTVLMSPATYVGANGPRYETPAEIEVVRRLGGDVVGMTATSEAIALREAGVAYANLSIVTNLAAGMESEKTLDHEEVVDVMESRGDLAVRILLSAVRSLAS